MANNIKFSLTAIEAKDLQSADSNGLSDPYFKIPHRQNGVVDIPGKKNRSKTIKKTLNPVWNHTFDVEFNPQICNTLNIAVYDYDILGKDDPIGNATISLELMKNTGQDTFDQWIPLNVSIKDKNTKTTKVVQKGSVHIKIQVKYRPQNLATVGQMITQQQPMPQQPIVQQPTLQQQIVQPSNIQQPIPQQMSQPPMVQQSNAQQSIPSPYPQFSQISSQQPPIGQQPPVQLSAQPPHMGNQPIAPQAVQRSVQPPMQPQYQQPMQPPYQQPMQPPHYQQQPMQPPNQPPYYQQPPYPQQNIPSQSYNSSPVQPPMGQSPMVQHQKIPSQSYSSQPVPYPSPIGVNTNTLPPQQPYPQPQPIGIQPQFAPHVSAPIISVVPNMMPPGIVPHKRGDALQPGTWIEVIEPSVTVGLGWDFTGGETFDLDASVTGFDYNYNPIESIYFNNKRGLNSSVIHFGDNRTGQGAGDDEVIKVLLAKVPMRVHFLAVTINSYKNNSLIKARSAYIRLYTDTYHIGKYILQRTKDCIGLLLGVFERDPNRNVWYFRVMADPIHGNKVTLSYEDIKTLLGSYSMRTINQGPRIVHPLPGEPLLEFNKWIQLPNRFTYIGLGWHIQQGWNYDLDASILSFNKMNVLNEIIFHKNLQSYDGSIRHYGDNRTGLGEGDDEVLSIDFAHVDPNVFSMAVIINSFKENSLVHVMDAFVRLYDPQKFIGVHLLKDCPECIGLCFGLFRKNVDGVWYFCAIKEIVQGNESSKSVNDVIYILDKYPLKV